MEAVAGRADFILVTVWSEPVLVVDAGDCHGSAKGIA
jgi:hypothetical protein